MSATARIMAYLGMNPADFNRGVDQAHSKVKGFEGALSGIKGKIAAAFTVGAAIAAVKNIATASGDIVDFAENLRVSTDEFQALTLAAKEYGLSQEDVVNALQKVMRAQEDAASANPSKTMAEAMRTLGITLDDLDSRNPAQLFEKIAKGAQGGADQMAASFDILGKSGTRFRSFLEGISQYGLEGAIQEARDSGKLIAEEALGATDAVIDQKIVPLVDRIKSYAGRAIGALSKVIVKGKNGFVAGDQNLDMSAANTRARERALDEKADEIMLDNAEKRQQMEFDALTNAEKRLRLEQSIASETDQMNRKDASKYERAILERDILDKQGRLNDLEKVHPREPQVDQFRRIGANVFGGTTIDTTAKKSLSVQEKMLVEMKAIRATAEKNKQGVF